MQSITQTLSESIEILIKNAVKIVFKNPRGLLYIRRFYTASKKADKKRKALEADGIHIPPFLIASIATECNLHCAGCYAIANKACRTIEQQLTAERWQEIFIEAEKIGISFILLAGGEPLLRKDVIEQAVMFPNIIFPVFTNGTLLNEQWLKFFDQYRNIIPVLSLEGEREETDNRRGEGVFQLLHEAMQGLKKKNILYGASVTITKKNIEQVTGEEFVAQLADLGCSLFFYVEYVPADGKSLEIAPADSEREFLRERLEVLRSKQNMIIIAFPGEEQDFEGCLAAGRGFFHISAEGRAEPCPFSPYSDMSLKDRTLLEALQSPLFKRLQSSELLQVQHQGGCVLFEQADLVEKMLNS